jgi:hypothetical protein
MTKTITEIKALSRTLSARAIRNLASIMDDKKQPAASRVSAAVALLDRGWGRPAQAISGDADNPLQVEVTQIVRTIVDPRDGGVEEL